MPKRLSRCDYDQLPRHSLIVCATLVQNPANLGGLCRTVEAFRLQKLVLFDLAAAQHPLFKSLSTSAHYWQPLEACPVSRLPEWLSQQGHEVIALTSASSAVSLTEFAFPKRSLLLLGQELTGIPASLLNCCNHRITIPQAGMVESLNVQTAAAIAIYEYVRQHPAAL
jgi:tRNA G18 (ribose-2'-O)-methylase SpoU